MASKPTLLDPLARTADPLALSRGIFEHSPVAYAVFARDGRFLLANPAYRALFGSEPPERYNLFRDEGALQISVAGYVQRAFAGETVQTPTFWYDPSALEHVRVENAHRVAIACTLFPLRDAGGQVLEIAIAYKDATSEERLRLANAIADNATVGLLMMDARQHCVFMNPAAEQITGYSLEQVQGRPLQDFVHHVRPDGSRFPLEDCPIGRSFRELRQTRCEDIFVRTDGSFYPVAFTASPIRDLAGVARGTVVELRDLSHEKLARAERDQLMSELEQAVRVRDEFLSIAGHEIRTPLTALLLNMQGLASCVEQLEPAQAAKLTSSVRRARENVVRLERLIEELLDVSRIVSSNLGLEASTVELGELVSEVTKRFSEQAAKAGTSLHVRSEAPLCGRWDRLRLEQVVSNLLSNALKYGRGKPVELSLQREGGDAVLTVVDLGIGIAHEDQARIFGRFERAVSSQHFGGLGLGLWIARQVIEASGGSIAVESSMGRGTRFTVRLPLDNAAV